MRGKDDDTHRQLLNVFKRIRKPSILVPYQDSGGNESLWVCKMAGKGQNNTVAHITSLRAIEGMCQGWRCIYFENLKTGWQCEKPDTQDAFEDYEFKDYNQSQLINFAFGDNVLQDLDHDIVKVMKGQKL